MKLWQSALAIVATYSSSNVNENCEWFKEACAFGQTKEQKSAMVQLESFLAKLTPSEFWAFAHCDLVEDMPKTTRERNGVQEACSTFMYICDHFGAGESTPM